MSDAYDAKARKQDSLARRALRQALADRKGLLRRLAVGDVIGERLQDQRRRGK